MADKASILNRVETVSIDIDTVQIFLNATVYNSSYKHAIFQKTYTDSSFTRHLNNGECDRYLCEGHHEAIVSHEVYRKANEVMKQRGKEKGNGENTQRYQNRYGFSGKIRCGECGGVFKRRIHYNVNLLHVDSPPFVSVYTSL